MMFLISMLLIACGGMMTDVLDSIVHKRFDAFYSEHTLLFWMTLLVNGVVVFLLLRSLVRVITARINSSGPEVRPTVGHSGLGITFTTTAFIRVTVYIAFYILGVSIAFL